MRNAALLVVVAAGVTLVLHAQSPVPPAFEVASVKANNSGNPGSRGQTGNATAIFTNYSARALITNAYNLRPNRLTGGPSWIDNERFDVNARALEGTPDSQIPLMLRTLLAERFRLAVRNETREEPVYALVAARGDKRLGPGIRPSTDCVKGGVTAGRAGGGLTTPGLEAGTPSRCGSQTLTNERGTTVTSGMRTMADLANLLRGVGEREVVDRTGISGTFDFELRYAPDSVRATAVDPSQLLPDVFTALQEQLGLKLESARGPVQYLVIERIERPTPD